ncbi:glycosyltransferase family 4 protein [Nostoc sp. WHI]|uniref:glycosyltransferase family 4 protein n=1 Tax=Nostoc sp. WHI TaxID=2650611 RepID=UPI0018C7E2D1|nr:glycosyltransferase family 1 protein [Nostoc sp. WHI]MBG1270760.1 glycosyltransferase family 4 protein [Nostoc sp. WHI]
MELQGINVLVDGYNLEMVQGTGIKTYGVTLVKALTSLGVNVDLLCSRSSNSIHSFLNEAVFFDIQNTNSRLKTKSIFLAVSQIFYEAKEIPVSDFVIKQDGDFIFDYLANSGKVFNIYDCYKVANSLYKSFQIQTRVRIPKKIDIWHTTYPIPIKINNAKRITTIHDIIPLKLPYTTLDNKKFFFNIINNAIKHSEIILTVSENTKEDILHCFDIQPEKIHVTYQPVIDNSNLVEEDIIPKFLKKYKLKFKKYILFVGAIEPKKNIGRLIDAYSGLDTDMQLVIVGKKGWLWEGEIGKLETIFGKGFTRKIKLLEYVQKKDLIYLYKGAFCFVFPSLYEGFGLPPLEAMSLECPVITSNIASLPEVCGDAALYVDPYNSNDIRQAIERLINDPQMKDQLIEAGKERVRYFSMENYAKKLYDAYSLVI